MRVGESHDFRPCEGSSKALCQDRPLALVSEVSTQDRPRLRSESPPWLHGLALVALVVIAAPPSVWLWPPSPKASATMLSLARVTQNVPFYPL